MATLVLPPHLGTRLDRHAVAFNDSYHQHHPRLRQVVPFVLVIFAVPLSCRPWMALATRREPRCGGDSDGSAHGCDERMTVAMALAESTHHTSRGQKCARAGVWGHELNYTAKIRKPPTPQPELFSLEEEPGGCLPAPLSEVAGRQDKVVRHVVEDLGELAPLVQIIDLPVPQTVDYVADALRILDFPIAEEVIVVPTISCSPCPSRSLVPEPQSAEQLVEVPTVLSPTRIALRIVEQIVDTPVPRGRGPLDRIGVG